MSEWTVERLRALPEKTVVLAAMGNPPDWMYLVLIRGAWWVLGYPDKYRTEDFVLYFDMSSIRVVSVPVNALLADETVRAAAGGHALGPSNSQARIVLGQAIAHATGETGHG